MLEKIVKQYPDVALVVKLLPFKGESSVSSARVALTTRNSTRINSGPCISG